MKSKEPSIADLFRKYGVTKLTKGYEKVYDELFAPIQNAYMTVLEIGVAEGRSLSVWLEYFPNSVIIGADLEKCDLQHRRLTQIVVDQSEPGSLKRNMPYHQIDGYPDLGIVIDDGSHKAFDMLITLGYLYQHLSKGGYYFIEDLDSRRAEHAHELIPKHMKGFKRSHLSKTMWWGQK